jgi:adenosylcobinamide-phosphate synthase
MWQWRAGPHALRSPVLTLHHNLALLSGALALEALAGYPPALFRAIRHPVVWMGALIGWTDRHLNHDTRAGGVLAVLLLLALSIGPAAALQAAAPLWLLIVLAASLPAQRSLHRHVAAVADALQSGGLPAGRLAVSQIVGRNPRTLDEAGVARAAIESLAENFSDGVVAPALWAAIGGLPGMVFYKAVNTADSMIGHRTPRHQRFGCAAARLDDLINLPASRLAAVWLVLAACLVAGASARVAARAAWRDAGRHRSPNAGWPEAAMAGALGLRLAGPRVYGATLVEDAWMGDGRADATVADIRRALGVYRVACLIELAFAVAAVWGTRKQVLLF